MCPFVKEINKVNEIKVLQSHYNTSHEFKSIQHPNPELSEVVQVQNLLDPKPTVITVGIFEVGKCLQQDCYLTKEDKKRLKASNLQYPSLKVFSNWQKLEVLEGRQ